MSSASGAAPPGRPGRHVAGPVEPDALAVEGLQVSYRVGGRDLLALRDVSLRVGPRQAYGLVGESGSGKSTVALAVTRYLARNGRVSGGTISVAGTDVLALRGERLRRLRAETVSMVYQEPGKALNPSIRVGRQLAEVFEIAGARRREALAAAEDALTRVQISDPRRLLERYPHELSGGMLQRVVIAMALASEPSLLILDEPTTALDATVEAEVLDLVSSLREELDTSILFISHNLAVIAKMCDRVGVLYAGELVEEGSASEVFTEPRHPYTVGLLSCIPRRGLRKDHGRLDTIPGFLPAPGSVLAGCIFAPRCGLVEAQCRLSEPPLAELGNYRRSRCYFPGRALEVGSRGAGPGEPAEAPAGRPPVGARAPLLGLRQVSKSFSARHEQLHALVGIDLEIGSGETLGLVGESGSGKTTLARAVLGLSAPDEGSTIELNGVPLAGSAGRRTGDQLAAVQIVFQNPDSALNRRHSVRRILRRALARSAGPRGMDREERLAELIGSVRMEPRQLGLRPAQLSGGLKQRVAIARAFAGEPALVVCDEPTSALDVSVQAAILNLLVELQARRNVSYLFISHDLGVVRYLADRIAVLYLGRLMEVGPAEAVFSGPQHPYTEALLSAVPSLDGQRRGRIRLTGEIPSAASPPSGCVFHTRCPRRLASGICESAEPPLLEVAAGRTMRCHIPLDELAQLQREPPAEAPAVPGASANGSSPL